MMMKTNAYSDWEEHLCVLFGHMLYIYSKGNVTVPMTVVLCEKISIDVEDESLLFFSGDMNSSETFRLTTMKGRSLYFATLTSESRNTWIKAILSADSFVLDPNEALMSILNAGDIYFSTASSLESNDVMSTSDFDLNVTNASPPKLHILSSSPGSSSLGSISVLSSSYNKELSSSYKEREGYSYRKKSGSHSRNPSNSSSVSRVDGRDSINTVHVESTTFKSSKSTPNLMNRERATSEKGREPTSTNGGDGRPQVSSKDYSHGKGENSILRKVINSAFAGMKSPLQKKHGAKHYSVHEGLAVGGGREGDDTKYSNGGSNSHYNMKPSRNLFRAKSASLTHFSSHKIEAHGDSAWESAHSTNTEREYTGSFREKSASYDNIADLPRLNTDLIKLKGVETLDTIVETPTFKDEAPATLPPPTVLAPPPPYSSVAVHSGDMTGAEASRGRFYSATLETTNDDDIPGASTVRLGNLEYNLDFDYFGNHGGEVLEISSPLPASNQKYTMGSLKKKNAGNDGSSKGKKLVYPTLKKFASKGQIFEKQDISIDVGTHRGDLLIQLLTAEGMDLVDALLIATPRSYQAELVRPLLFIACWEGEMMALIELSIKMELNNTSNANTAFRSGSFSNQILVQVTRLVSEHFIDEVIGPLIRDLLSKKPYLRVPFRKKNILLHTSSSDMEIDPKKIAREGADNVYAQQQANAKVLMDVAQIFLDTILESKKIPRELYHICSALYNAALRKYGDIKAVQPAVASFFFLHLICPAITSPHTWGIMKDPPESHDLRSLLLVTKLIQNVSAGVSFGGKELYMSVVNEFVEKNNEKVKTFIYQNLCMYGKGEPPKDFGYDLARFVTNQRLNGYMYVICDKLRHSYKQIADILGLRDPHLLKLLNDVLNIRNGASGAPSPSLSPDNERRKLSSNDEPVSWILDSTRAMPNILVGSDEPTKWYASNLVNTGRERSTIS